MVTFKECLKHAEKLGGKCFLQKNMSEDKVKATDKIIWECKEGHVWKTDWRHIRDRKSWCGICAHKRTADKQRFSIEKMQELAAKHGGQCLSTDYKNAWQELKWQCKYGHIFNSTYHSIQQNKRWCGECNSSLGERLCRFYFEAIFETKFPRKKPKWLGGLELDGYSKKLKIAFEHQGEQHYRTCKNFRVDEKRLEYIKANDDLKSKLCDIHGVRLFIIPQLFIMTKLNELPNMIKEQCFNYNIELSKDISKIEVSELSIINSNKEYYLDRLSKAVEAFEGKVLSTLYVNAHHKLQFSCEKHNINFYASPNSVFRGSWGCKYCKTTKVRNALKYLQKDISEFEATIKSKGGQLLSKEYVNSKTKLSLVCENGHVLEMFPQNLLRGHWCKICTHRKGYAASSALSTS